MYVFTVNDFRVRTKRAKQHYYMKRKQIRYLNIFNIINILKLLGAGAKSAILLRVPSLTKVEVRNFSLLIFPDGSFWLVDNLLCLCDLWKGRSYVNSNVSVHSIFNNGQFYLKYYPAGKYWSPGRPLKILMDRPGDVPIWRPGDVPIWRPEMTFSGRPNPTLKGRPWEVDSGRP